MEWCDHLFNWPPDPSVVDFVAKIILTVVLAGFIVATFKWGFLNIAYKTLSSFVVGDINKNDKEKYELYVKNISATVMSGVYVAVFAPVIFGSHITSTGVDINADARMWQPIVTAVGGLLVLITVIETRRKNDADIDKQLHDRKIDIISRRYDQQAKALEQLDAKNVLITRITGLRTLLNLTNEFIEENRIQQVQDIINDLCNYIRSTNYLVINKYFNYYKNNKDKVYNIKSTHLKEYILLNPKDLDSEDERKIRDEVEIRKLFFSSIRNYLINGIDAWKNIEFDFSESIFFYDIDLSGITWENKANFSNSIFLKKVDFSKSVFKKEAIFNGVEVVTPVDRKNSPDGSYEDCKVHEKVKFNNITYNDNANFNETVFFRSVTFNESEFLGEAKFNESYFLAETTFDKSIFVCNAEFEEITSNYEAIHFLKNNPLNKKFIFNINKLRLSYAGCWFYKEFNFKNCQSFKSDFNKCIFLGKVDFMDSKFYENLNFGEVFSLCIDYNWELVDTHLFHSHGVEFDYNSIELSGSAILIFFKHSDTISTICNDNSLCKYNIKKYGNNDDVMTTSLLFSKKDNDLLIGFLDKDKIQEYQKKVRDMLAQEFFPEKEYEGVYESYVPDIRIRENALNNKNNISQIIDYIGNECKHLKSAK